MRKSQIQPSLASLSEADREQLADWLRHGEYDDVLARANEPRPEGLGLDISKKPLQTFYAKVALLDLINSRLPGGKKLALAVFENLACRDILLLSTADPSKIAEIHDTILGTVHDLVKSGDNTPAQLLSLQRLADFPARAALREQIAEIQAERLQLQRDREDRLGAMQAHKIAMDLRREERAERNEQRATGKDAHKEKRDREQSERSTKHLDFSGKRLRLSMKSLALRRKQHRERMKLARERMEKDSQGASNGSVKKADHLGPIATDWKGVGERVCKLFGITPEEEARRAELHKTWKDPHARPGIPEEINPIYD